MKYKYWNLGDKRPATTPKGCQYQNLDGNWFLEFDLPIDWWGLQRRWPVTPKVRKARPTSVSDGQGINLQMLKCLEELYRIRAYDTPIMKKVKRLIERAKTNG